MRSEQRKRRRHQRRWQADEASPSATHVSAHHVCSLATLPTVQCPIVPLSVWSPLVAFEIRMRQRFYSCFSFHLSMLAVLFFSIFPPLPTTPSSLPPSSHSFSPRFLVFSSLLILQIFVLIVSLCVCQRVCECVCVSMCALSVSAFRTVHVIFCAVASPVCPTASSSSSLSFGLSSVSCSECVSQSRIDVCYACI